MAREVIKIDSKYFVQSVTVMNEVTDASLQAELADLQAEKTAMVAQTTATYDAKIAELEGLIAELQLLTP